MTPLTVLVVPDGPLQTVASALRDWSAAGLVSEFAVVSPRSSMSEVTVDVVKAGKLSRTTLERLLAERVPSIVRLVVLTDWSGSDVALAHGSATQLATSLVSGSGARVIRAALVLTLSDRADQEPVGLEGWHNVVIAPEDGRGPTAPHAGWPSGEAGDKRAALILPSLVVLVGLQQGLPRSPLDDEQPLPGIQFRVARGYLSRLDGRDVERRLRSVILSLDAGYPRVKDGSASSTYIENLTLATDQMAGRWWKVTGPLLISPRRQMKVATDVEISLWRALKLFFGFMWSVIKGAPAAWLNRTITAANTGVAGAATGALFGSGSAYTVVVGGVRGDGKPATWQERAEAFRFLDASLPALSGEHVVHADLGNAWRCFIEGALALLDGLTRNEDLPSIEVGGQIGIIRRGVDVCPGQDGAYRLKSQPVVAATKIHVVLAYDFLGYADLLTRLESLGQDQLVGPAANAEMQSAQAWWNGSRQRFAPRVAETIGSSLDKVAREIRAYADELKHVVEPPDLSLEEHHAQRRLARRLRFILVAGLLLMVGSFALGAFAIIAWAIAAILLLGCVVMTVSVAFTIFWRGQRQIFQLIHRLRETSARADVLDYNLRTAIRDAGRLADAYVLQQHWAQILGVFVADPFGTSASKHDQSAVLDPVQPLSAHFATGTVDEVAVAEEAAWLGSSLYVTGWLGPVWDQYLAASVHSLGSRGVSLGAPEDLYSQKAAAADTILEAVAVQRMRDGSPPKTGEDTWAELLNKSSANGRSLYRVIPGVQTVEGQHLPSREFVGRFDPRGEPTPFRQSLFSAQGIVDGSLTPGMPWSVEEKVGLSSVRSLAVLSPGMPPAHLVAFKGDRDNGGFPVDDPDDRIW